MVSSVARFSAQPPLPISAPDPGVDDDAIQPPHAGAEIGEGGGYGVGIGHIERGDLDPAGGTGGGDLGLQSLKLFDAPRAQRQMPAARRDLARHAGAEAGTGAGDEGDFVLNGM